MSIETRTTGERDMHRQEGQTLSEYALLLAFIFAVCILAVGALGVVVSGELRNVADLLP